MEKKHERKEEGAVLSGMSVHSGPLWTTGERWQIGENWSIKMLERAFQAGEQPVQRSCGVLENQQGSQGHGSE